MGDKTQLATVALACRFNSIVSVWLGTTTGMLVADAIGIIIGIVLGKKIPERLIKWFAALVFIAFGLIGLYETVSIKLFLLITVLVLLLLIVFWRVTRKGRAMQ